MRTEVYNPTPAQRLKSALELRGDTALELERTIVPVVDVSRLAGLIGTSGRYASRDEWLQRIRDGACFSGTATLINGVGALNHFSYVLGNLVASRVIVLVRRVWAVPSVGGRIYFAAFSAAVPPAIAGINLLRLPPSVPSAPSSQANFGGVGNLDPANSHIAFTGGFGSGGPSQIDDFVAELRPGQSLLVGTGLDSTTDVICAQWTEVPFDYE